MHIDVLAPDPNFSVTATRKSISIRTCVEPDVNIQADARYMEYPVGACTIPDAVSVPDSDVRIGMAICLGDEVLDSLNC